MNKLFASTGYYFNFSIVCDLEPITYYLQTVKDRMRELTMWST